MDGRMPKLKSGAILKVFFFFFLNQASSEPLNKELQKLWEHEGDWTSTGFKKEKKNYGKIKTENHKSKIQTLVLIKINSEFPKVLKLPKTTLQATGLTPENPHIILGLELVTLVTSLRRLRPPIWGYCWWFSRSVSPVAKKTEKQALKCQSWVSETGIQERWWGVTN